MMSNIVVQYNNKKNKRIYLLPFIVELISPVGGGSDGLWRYPGNIVINQSMSAVMRIAKKYKNNLPGYKFIDKKVYIHESSVVKNLDLKNGNVPGIIGPNCIINDCKMRFNFLCGIKATKIRIEKSILFSGESSRIRRKHIDIHNNSDMVNYLQLNRDDEQTRFIKLFYEHSFNDFVNKKDIKVLTTFIRKSGLKVEVN